MHKPAVENKGLMSVKCLFSGMRDTEMVFHIDDSLSVQTKVFLKFNDSQVHF